MNIGSNEEISIEKLAKKVGKPKWEIEEVDNSELKKKITKEFESDLRKAFKEVDKKKRSSMNSQKPCTVWFTGLSGSGKSTIALMAVGLLRPSSGHILIDGHNLYDRSRSEAEHRRIRQRLQMVFQSPYASLNPRWRVGSILAEPLRVFGLAQGPKAETHRVHELLELSLIHI